MGPNEKRGRVKVQLVAAAENLCGASEELKELGDEYRGIALMLLGAGEVLEGAAIELSAMWEREIEAERKK